MTAESDFDAIARLLRELEDARDDATRERARALVATLLRVHARALAQVLDHAQGTDPALVERLAADPAIAPLLMLHGLHPQPLEARVRDCVARLAPRAAAQRARLTLTAVDAEGRVRLALVHAGKATTLRADVEDALGRAAADASEIVIDESTEVVVQFAGMQGSAPS